MVWRGCLNGSSKAGVYGTYLPYARQIKRLGERLNELEKRMEGVHSPQLNGMPRGTRRYSLNDDMARYDELMMRVQSLWAEAQPIKSEILNCIDKPTGTPSIRSLRAKVY
ncbi:hypothetical protein [Lactiplantibacillus plantarum]|uniref:hypothetical protein n=1 Tax=Lactiplantibacillus plantarum TaxID=1590 RepID=UPI0013C3F990|nr:hypothetical protein [Lactiplantibacillus plantarum]